MVAVGIDHLDPVAMEAVEGVVDLEEIEMTEEVAEEELATTVTRLDIWQETAPKATAEKEEAVEEAEVDLEAEVVVAAGLATIATKKGTWQGNAPKVTAEIVEANTRQV